MHPIKAFRPLPVPSDVNVLSNAQIAQIMVRHGEALSDPSAIYAAVLTLGGVRELRQRVGLLLTQAKVEHGDPLLRLIDECLGIGAPEMVDCDFE